MAQHAQLIRRPTDAQRRLWLMTSEAVTVSAKDNAHPPTFGSTSFNWYVGNAAPQIDQVVPVIGQGAGGIRVVISGRDFSGASSVLFGTVASGSITVNRAGTRISTFAPSRVPMVSAPFSASFMFPVPEASLPAVEICSERSAAGMIFSARETR